MSIKLFAYKQKSYDECVDFIKWCQNTMNLRDWNILFEYGSGTPTVFGTPEENTISPAACIPQWQFLHAYLWVIPERAEIHNVHPFELIAHEMLHVMFSIIYGVAGDKDLEEDDVIITRLEGLYVEMYYRQHRKKVPTYKEY